jgi:hypothetical protein
MKLTKRLAGMFIAALAFTFVTHAQMSVKTNGYTPDPQSPTQPDSGPLPKIKWDAPNLEFTTSTENKVHLKARVEARSELKELKLVVFNSADGSTISTKRFSVEPGLIEQLVDLTVTLPEGTIDLMLQTTAASGYTVSERRQILVGKDAADNLVTVNRKDYVLLFATNKYDHWNDLVNPVSDATAIAQELKNIYGFEVDLVEDPTVERIWEKLREYNERKFQPQDQLLIFFAGHGHYDEAFGEGYVVAKNSLANDLSRTTYLSHNRLRGVINNIQCAHILLTMDVCFGGTLDPVVASSRGAIDTHEVSPTKMLARKFGHRTRKYLTSGGKEYVSDGIPDKHSPFAAKLIESLRSVGGTDRILTLTELMVNFEKMSQLPRFGSFGGDEPLSDFVFIGKR